MRARSRATRAGRRTTGASVRNRPSAGSVWLTSGHRRPSGVSELGSLDPVRQVVRLAGYVNSVPGFAEAPAVIDGASDLLVEVFGEDRGSHARISLYQSDLPRQAPVACELTLYLR